MEGSLGVPQPLGPGAPHVALFSLGHIENMPLLFLIRPGPFFVMVHPLIFSDYFDVLQIMCERIMDQFLGARGGLVGGGVVQVDSDIIETLLPFSGVKVDRIFR